MRECPLQHDLSLRKEVPGGVLILLLYKTYSGIFIFKKTLKELFVLRKENPVNVSIIFKVIGQAVGGVVLLVEPHPIQTGVDLQAADILLRCERLAVKCEFGSYRKRQQK